MITSVFFHYFIFSFWVEVYVYSVKGWEWGWIAAKWRNVCARSTGSSNISLLFQLWQMAPSPRTFMVDTEHSQREGIRVLEHVARSSPLSTGRFPIYLAGEQFGCLGSFRICLHWQLGYILANKYSQKVLLHILGVDKLPRSIGISPSEKEIHGPPTLPSLSSSIYSDWTRLEDHSFLLISS